MIDKKDLRYGNLVILAHESNAPIVTVAQIKNRGIVWESDRDNGYSGFYLLMPIELSPEWLDKFGFRKNGFNEYVLSISPWPEFLIKEVYFSGDYVYMREGKVVEHPSKADICTLWNNDLRGKMPLHMLQNTIYYLTGEELTIQPKQLK